MFLPLIVVLLFASVAADDSLILSEVSEQSTVEKFDETCSTTGQEVKGIVWSTCKKGKKVVKGCRTASGVKVELGGLFGTDKAVYECRQEGGKVVLKPIKCVFWGKEYSIGDTFEYESFHYECIERPTGIAVKAIGCGLEGGDMALVGEEFRKGKFIFSCQILDGRITVVGVKCYVPSLDAVYEVGQEYELDGYYYQCQKGDRHGIKIKPVSCADPDGKKVELSDEYISGRAVIQCQKIDGSFQHVLTGCYAKDHRTDEFKKYRQGESFYESYTDHFAYVKECSVEEGRVHHRTVQCIHLGETAEHHIDIGCAVHLEKKIFVCKRGGKGGPKSVSAKFMSSTDKDFAEILAKYELRDCEKEMKVVTYY